MSDIKKIHIGDEEINLENYTIDPNNIEFIENEDGVYMHFKNEKDAEVIVPLINNLLNDNNALLGVEDDIALVSETPTRATQLNGGAFYRSGSRYLGNHVQKVGMYTENVAHSLMHVFGQGDGETNGMINAGRIIKGKRDFIIEIKAGENLYCGLQLRGNYGENNALTGKGEIYTSTYSKVQACIENDNADMPVWRDNLAYGIESGCGDLD